MIFLIFIKNIKKMNCLICLICLGDSSGSWCYLSKLNLGNFLDYRFSGKILSFFVIFAFQGLLRCYLIQMIIFWRGNSGSQLMEPLE